jgi:hypothetical protein
MMDNDIWKHTIHCFSNSVLLCIVFFSLVRMEIKGCEKCDIMYEDGCIQHWNRMTSNSNNKPINV